MRYVIADEDKVKFVHFDGKFKYLYIKASPIVRTV